VGPTREAIAIEDGLDQLESLSPSFPFLGQIDGQVQGLLIGLLEGVQLVLDEEGAPIGSDPDLVPSIELGLEDRVDIIVHG
jgi:hypothetical protein